MHCWVLHHILLLPVGGAATFYVWGISHFLFLSLTPPDASFSFLASEDPVAVDSFFLLSRSSLESALTFCGLRHLPLVLGLLLSCAFIQFITPD